jgi:N-methylhydantoinase A
MYVISTDTGGTFVDAALVDEAGQLFVGKAPSTPRNPAQGLLASIDAAALRRGTTAADVLSQCRMFVNGTTVTTNALLERRGAKTGFITTAGFEDTLLIGRVKARTAGLDELAITDYRHAERPEPIVSAALTRGVRERVDFQGRVLAPLDLDEAAAVVDDLVAEGVEAIAICLLWAFRNPAHERALTELIAERHPEVYVTASSDLVPVIREYERANTTAINCFLGPTLRRYVDGVEQAVSETGYDSAILIMQSIGGLSPANELANRSVTSLHSGPVGGIVAAQKLGEALEERNIITADMGGTSFDVGLIVDGVPQSASTTVVERNILLVPAVEAVSIGAGGGSVAWLDEVGALRVGPRSMGADPGPACYGRGGTTRTVTDADVVLGYINPDYFLGGTMKLDRERAVAAIEETIAVPLGISTEEAAAGIYQIVNSHMADLIRQVTVERGYDPRAFTLVNFGGCGPTHSTGYGPELQLKGSLIPAAASIFSAVGIGQSGIRHFFSRSLSPMTLVPPGEAISAVALDEVNTVLGELLEEGRKQLLRDDVEPERGALTPQIELRYQGQTNELTVPIPGGLPVTAEAFARIVQEFTTKYEMLYGRGSRSLLSAIELITIRVDATAATAGTYEVGKPHDDQSGPAAVGSRSVYWRDLGYEQTPIFRGELLQEGDRIEGPAVIETYGTTIPLHPGQRLESDRLGNFLIHH